MIVLLRDVRKTYAKMFVLISFMLCVWIVTNYITNHYTGNLVITNIANNLAFVSGFGVLAAGLLLTYFFPVKRPVSSVERIAVTGTVLIGVGLSMTESVAGVVTLDPDGHLAFSIGSLLWLYGLAFISMIVLMARNLLTIPKTENRLKRRQARLILVAFGVTAIFGFILNLVIPVIWSDWYSTRLGPLVSIILVGTIAYTIIRHGLFDIRFAVVRTVTYIFSLATLAAVYYLSAYAISETFFRNDLMYAGQAPLNIGLALLLAFIFQPVKRFFDRLTNSIFFHDDYSTDDFLKRLGKELSTTSDLRNLLHRASNEIGGTIQADQAFFFVRYGGDHHMNEGTTRHGRMSPDDVVVLDDYVHREHSTVVIADIIQDTEEVYGMLSKNNIAIALPLKHDGQSPNYLFIGHRRSREYSRRDVRVLETISNELVIAIQNALSVQEVRDINATLQQRIEEATKELRQSNTQLQRLDAAKDEFVSMASHQLRTPLTSVKGYISMVLEGDAGRISGAQRQLLSEAFTSSERMVHLIGDFLNVSRLQTGKFMIDQRPVDLAKIIGQEVDSLKTTAEAHSLKLRYKVPSYFPVLYIDEGKIRQVVMNFIDNAIYYSHEGTTITVGLRVDGGDALLEVHDTGIGVPKSEQAHLFTKFFRATNAQKQRPDGTGVGLFLAKKVIVAHGGTMVFESKEGEGSTFGFRLPVKRLSNAPADEADELEK